MNSVSTNQTTVPYTFQQNGVASQAVGAVEPRSLREAVNSIDAEQWQVAAKDEMSSLVKAQGFHLVPLAIARGRVMTSKWVFKVKRQSDGSIE